MLVQMSFAEFKASLAQPNPPPTLSPALLGLWHDARGDWDRAHGCVQDDASVDGAWVHAYLHRKEGDAANAAYWYARAKKPVAGATLTEEWAEISRSLLGT
jgi:hypothetical protein